MLAALHRWPLRVFAALLLAVLCAQALPYQPISLDRGRGPVFSAATAEVTLPPREDEAELVCTLAAPCPDERPSAAGQLPVIAAAVIPGMRERWAAHRVRGPPLRPPPRSIAAPRGPPHLS
ncbi:hypothetical protein [Qipengyuania flava]|uniref:hypothetical protein n=1 Tax=Qipengyuania flava TaxID=192812 RepID=UPI001C63728B|nr:hypothetical protein [Qipengyuania flava]QYJ07068.1 hypothetical protein KUV82_13690 [Qipengyuania flava]